MEFQDLTLGDLRDLSQMTVLVAVCADAGLFRALAEAPVTPGVLAARLGIDRRATRIVLQALVETGLLVEEGGAFRPGPRCRRELCDPDDSAYVAGGLPHWLETVRAWTHLGEVLKRGGPLEPGALDDDPESLAHYMAAMAAAPAARVERLVDLCLARNPGARSILDLGGGPGHMTRAFVARGLKGTLFDRRHILDHVVQAYGLDRVEGLETVAGDAPGDPLPEGPFDIVLLSNVVHIHSSDVNRALLAQVARVTSEGGVVAVADMLRGRSGRAARFGVQMLLMTDEGDAYSADDIRGWIEPEGFGDVQVEDLEPDRQLLTAVRD